MAQSKLTNFFMQNNASAGPSKITPEESDSSKPDLSPEPGPSSQKKASVKPRAFCEKWLSLYEWLYLEDGKMKCHPCIKTRQDNPFVFGCENFRTSTLVRHQKTSSHISALESLKLSASMSKSMNNAQQEHERIQTSGIQVQRHIVQLRTVYCMAKNGISAKIFPALMQLQKDNGCKSADEYYSKQEIVTEMESVLSDQVRNSLFSEIKNSPFFGLMLDETCDINVEKKLCVYVRYISDSKACTSYLGNKRVTDCTALGLKTALCRFLEEIGLIEDENFSCLMGLGTDGAAVMVGCRSGLGVRLKELNDRMIQVHCVAHRLNLAVSQASKDINYMQDYHKYIQTLYRFFSDSQVRYDKLRDLQNLLHGEVRQVPEGTSVRWLSIESAVKMIFDHFDAIVMTLENDKDNTGKAAGLWRFIASSIFLLVTALLIDVLTCIGILSLTFQKDSVNLSSIRHNVDSTISSLNTMRNGSLTVNNVLEQLNARNVEEPTKYMNVLIKHNENNLRQFNSVREIFLNHLIENLNNRFPHDDLNLLESFDKIFNPRRYPQNQKSIYEYGIVQLDSLCDHYSTLLDVQRCKGQFLQFKHLVMSHKVDYGDFDSFVKLLLDEYSDIYPDFIVLASISLVIPVSSAPCERGFSQQNVLKSKLRNRLNPERLGRLLMIRLNGDEGQNIDFLSAARAFGVMKTRKK